MEERFKKMKILTFFSNCKSDERAGCKKIEKQKDPYYNGRNKRKPYIYTADKGDEAWHFREHSGR